MNIYAFTAFFVIFTILSFNQVLFASVIIHLKVINKTKSCCVVFVNKETGKKEFLEICEIEGDKKNQANTIGMQLDGIIANAGEENETCDTKFYITIINTASIENVINKHCINCLPKLQAECPYKFTNRCMQVCYYLFVKKWTPNQIAGLLKCGIPNINNFKKLCFNEVGLAGKDRRTAKLRDIWMQYYADWVDTEVHLP